LPDLTVESRRICHVTELAVVPPSHVLSFDATKHVFAGRGGKATKADLAILQTRNFLVEARLVSGEWISLYSRALLVKGIFHETQLSKIQLYCLLSYQTSKSRYI
jgi:hypothetical protein